MLEIVLKLAAIALLAVSLLLLMYISLNDDGPDIG